MTASGACSPALTKVLWLVAGKIETRATQAIACRGSRWCHCLWQRRLALAEARAPHRGFDPRRNHEWQRAFIDDGQVGVLDPQYVQNIPHLLPDAFAIVEIDARAQLNVDAATAALLKADVQVRTNVQSRRVPPLRVVPR
jgi:hypothetical protein